MQRAVAKPLTDAITRTARAQSKAVAKAAGKAARSVLTGVASPTPAPVSRGTGAWHEGVFAFGLMQRHYRLFVPDGVTKRRPAPLLVLLHGCGQDAASFAASARVAAVARSAGCVVLMPEQSMQANAQRCWNWFLPGGRGAAEAELLTLMVDHVCGRVAIRQDQVCTLGLSAGGPMALMLGLRYPRRFAAVGSHSGALPGSAANAAQAARAMRGHLGQPAVEAGTLRLALAGHRPPPLLLLHGDADHIVHIDNATACAALWLDLQPDAESVRAKPMRPRTVQRGTRRAMEISDWMVDGEPWVRLVRIAGLGHAWSGGAAGQAFSDPSGPDALRIALAFFGIRPR